MYTMYGTYGIIGIRTYVYVRMYTYVMVRIMYIMYTNDNNYNSR